MDREMRGRRREYLRVTKGGACEEFLHGVDFVSRVHPREDQRPVGIRIRGIYPPELFNLLLVQTRTARRIPPRRAQQRLRPEVAPAGHLDDAVGHPVQRVALPEDLVVDQPRPELRPDEIGRADSAGDGIEHGPLALQVVEVHGGSSRDDAVVVAWVDLCCLDSHAAAEGAPEVVRVGRRSVVEGLCEQLTRDGAGMEAGYQSA